MDEKDKQILAKLTLNARMPLLQLSREINLAPTSVTNRISTLIKKSAINSFIPYASFSFIGYQWYVLELRTKNLDQKSFVQYLRQHKNAVWLSKRVGKWNYYISIFAKNNTEFNQIVQDIQRKFHESIIDYNSLTVFKQYKYSQKVE